MNKQNQNKKVTLFALVGNLFLLFVKGITGFIFQSQAMIADSMNSAGDIFASLMAFVGSKISNIPADEDHNMGHGKAEYIYSLFIGLSMVLVALLLISNTITSILDKKVFKFSFFLVSTSIVTIIIKLSLYIYTRTIYKKNKSILIKSLYHDHINDVLITSCTLIGIIFSYYDIFLIDKLIGIGISLWIMLTGIKILHESYNVLLDQSIDLDSKLQIENIVNNYNDVVKMGKLSSMPIGDSYIIVLTIYVHGDMPTRDAHKITKEIQAKIKKKIKLIDRVIIHVNPID